MAKRPILDKKIAAMRRALRKGRLRASLDLVQWLKDHGHAQTTGEAERLILSERVKVDSHPLGVHELDLPDARGRLVKQRVLYRLVPADTRARLVVEPE